MIGLGSAALAAAAVLAVLQVAGLLPGGSETRADPGRLFNQGAILGTPTPQGAVRATATPSPARPAPSPTPAPPPAAVDRLIIPRIGVDAPVVPLGLTPDGTMDAPDGPQTVGWYRFTAHPGAGGNAVFGAHFDWYDGRGAVFAGLDHLGPGDHITVRLADGTAYTYAVTAKALVDADDAPVAEIVGPTPAESITLITCGGTYSHDQQRYLDRLVVRAERVGGQTQ